MMEISEIKKLTIPLKSHEEYVLAKDMQNLGFIIQYMDRFMHTRVNWDIEKEVIHKQKNN